MDDRLKESISALIDDEANELELQRVLSHADKGELLDTWASYHRVRSVLKSDNEELLAIDISQSVSQMISQEAPLQLNDELSESAFDESTQIQESSVSQSEEPAKRADSGRYTSRISSGLAIAASVAFALFFVLQSSVNEPLNVNDSQVAAVSPVGSTSALQRVNISNDLIHKQPKIIVEFSEEHARRFNEYLLRHAEHSVVSSSAGLMPLARVASVNAVGI